MKMLLLSLIALFSFASFTAAQDGYQPGVPDGSTWTDGQGNTVTVDITSNPTVNTVTVVVTHGNASSYATVGTPGDNSSVSAPTCQLTPSMNVGGRGYRCKGSKLQRAHTRSDGTHYWTNMRIVRDGNTGEGDVQQRSGGGTDEVTSLPW